MPRFALSVNVAVVWSVPPLSVSCPGVAEPGAVPRLLSAPIDRMPALIVVEPLYEFEPDSVSVDDPFLVSVPDPLIVLLSVQEPVRLRTSAELSAMLPLPAEPVA